MNEIRRSFLDCSRAALGLARSDEVAGSWDQPSILPMFSLRGLVGHMMRATLTVEMYLDRDPPEGNPITAAAYYAAAVDTIDPTAPTNVEVREKGEERAAGGHAALMAEWDQVLDRLGARLGEEPDDRAVQVFGELALPLDEYLVTRIIETVVHADDVAASVGLPVPDFPKAAWDAAIDALVELGRLRHGDVAVIRALTRRERDAVGALRVL